MTGSFSRFLPLCYLALFQPRRRQPPYLALSVAVKADSLFQNNCCKNRTDDAGRRWSRGGDVPGSSFLHRSNCSGVLPDTVDLSHGC